MAAIPPLEVDVVPRIKFEDDLSPEIILARLRMEPDDMLVIHVPQGFAPSQWRQMAEHFQRLLPDHKVTFVPPGARLERVQP